jgi:hypothetical protein
MLSLMSSGDFASELQQSVADHIAFIHTAATAAKARIGAGIVGSQPLAPEPADLEGPRPTVNFSMEEPAYGGPGETQGAEALFPDTDTFVEEDPAFADARLPEGAITYDDGYGGGNIDDDGIPVWEDPP